jgi:hypothetical protein
VLSVSGLSLSKDFSIEFWKTSRRTNKTQRTKTMATPTLPRNLGVYTGVPNNIKYEVIALVEMHVL